MWGKPQIFLYTINTKMYIKFEKICNYFYKKFILIEKICYNEVMKTIKKINYINSEEDTYGDTFFGGKN
ncbi:hypothetical protein C1142_19840 [Clostridium botulinum]|nr:hypothetical protein [Clostridium botulinum]RUT56155.1 hypothetical protein C1142_19840 [Clostridium botulinum]